jgi:hypothetical protein
MLTRGTLAGLVGAVAPADTQGTGTQEINLKPVTEALSGIRDELRHDPAAVAVSRDVIGQIRRAQKQHFRTNGRFPAWIDIGIDVFECVHDWHVRNLQQVMVGHDGTGRYTVTFFFSTLVLRPDVEPSYISTPYDER